MYTSREPYIYSVANAVRHRVIAFQFGCYCGKRRVVPVLVAHWLFGDVSLEAMAKRFRCSCGNHPWKPTPLWRRPRAWWKHQHKGPLPEPPYPYRRRN